MADITAHISGTIFSIVKQVGEQVAVGEEVFLLESMKMEIPVESPAAGVITQIMVQEGDAVEEGAVLAVVA